jgi:intracellular septation protein
MKMLIDFLPIVAFFVVFKVVPPPEGVFYATGAAIASAAALVAFTWLKHRQVSRQQLIMLGVLVVLGGATLAFHDERFIKWKPTVVSWLMGAGFLGTQFFGGKTLVERMLGESLSAPHAVWRRLNLAWVVFFAAMGALNLYVAFNFPTATWVNFKLFGTLGLTLAFAFAQAFYLTRYDVTPTNDSGD